MPFPPNILAQIEDLSDESEYTPELFAWALLLKYNSTDTNKLTAQLNTFTDTVDPQDNKETFNFEILLTIFVELILNIMQLDYYSDESNVDPYIFDFSKIDLDSVIDILVDKFKMCGINLQIKTIANTKPNQHEIKTINQERYCNIIIKSNPDDQAQWLFYSGNIPGDKPYHMILNKAELGSNKKLNQIYGVCSIHNMILQISFSKINYISNPKPFDLSQAESQQESGSYDDSDW